MYTQFIFKNMKIFLIFLGENQTPDLNKIYLL